MFTKGILKGERGNRGPYFNLFTKIISFGNNMLSIEELGILKTSKTNNLAFTINDIIKKKAKTAFMTFLKKELLIKIIIFSNAKYIAIYIKANNTSQNKWILRFVLCQRFRYCNARHFGANRANYSVLICAI
jgi:hypothetical protein